MIITALMFITVFIIMINLHHTEVGVQRQRAHRAVVHGGEELAEVDADLGGDLPVSLLCMCIYIYIYIIIYIYIYICIHT